MLIVVSSFSFIADAAEDDLSARARAIHRDAILIDGHNDVAMWIVDMEFDLALDGWERDDRWAWIYFYAPWLPGKPSPQGLRTHSDLARFERGGVGAQFFSVWAGAEYYDEDQPTSGRSFARANKIMDALDAQFERHGARLELALSQADVRRIAATGKLAALLGVEGGHMIEHDLDKLRHLYQRGARYMTLTWSFSHTWADAAGDPLQGATQPHDGLSKFGEEVVREMNALGMLVDISHVSDATFYDAIEVSDAPVIASHSSVRALADHPRNISDDMLRALARNGGVIMINFSNLYLDERKTSTWRLIKDWLTHFGSSRTGVEHVADHIEHVIEVAGVDHVGIGSDFDGVPFVPAGLAHVGEFPNLTIELLRRGHSVSNIEKILGENLLRVLGEAEKVAKSAYANRARGEASIVVDGDGRELGEHGRASRPSARD